MNKINYFALGVLCTVLLGGMFSFASAKWSLFSSNEDNAQLAPSRALVNAHQCNADGVCEMNDAKVITLTATNEVIASTLSSTYVNAGKGEFSTGVKTPLLQIYNPLIGVIAGHITEAGDALQIYAYDNRSIEFKPQNGVRFANLVGNGTAYACLDAQGKLFRKMTPCV